MLSELKYCLVVSHVILMCAVKKSDSNELFYPREDDDIRAALSCTSTAAKSLFSFGHRIVIVYREQGAMEGAIVRALMKGAPTVIANRPVRMKSDRVPSYIVIDYGNFSYSREILITNDPVLHTLQYLFVTKATRAETTRFADELWKVGFRDIAFVMADNSHKWIIMQPESARNRTGLRSLGYCTPSGNNIGNIRQYSSNIYRFCSGERCKLVYGSIVDETIHFWRNEDKLRSKENAPNHNHTIERLIIKRFGRLYNMTVDFNSEVNLSWREASRKLLTGEVDIVDAIMPDNAEVMDGLELICWYMFRDIVFAAKVRYRTPGNDLLKMLTPFHYWVWICAACLLILYVILLSALRRLHSAGLIRERLEFMQVWAIMLGQGVTFPRKFALKLVLLMWMIYSLYLSITYNSTFTSSLAQIEMEDLLRSAKDLRDSGQSISGPAIVRSYLNDTSDKVMRDLAERYVITTPNELFKSIYANYGVAAIQHFTVTRMNWAQRSNRTRRLYTIPDIVVRFPIFFITRKGHPYRNPLRLLVTEYRGLGLIKKWSSTYLIEEDKGIVNQPSTDEILTMKHLLSAFQLFFVCQGISCLAFLIEFLHNYTPLRLFR